MAFRIEKNAVQLHKKKEEARLVVFLLISVLSELSVIISVLNTESSHPLSKGNQGSKGWINVWQSVHFYNFNNAFDKSWHLVFKLS